ncbi:MAG: hypothetical protein ACN6P1_05500 [Pseudomonas sp.]|uniref:hypothetical protein n=1 Tax=Pseudomonas sp. TaxID=306 RepID=UPI003D0F5100
MSRGPLSVTFTGQRNRLQTLDHLEREQLPFAAALALTRTAQEVQKGLRHEMTNVFDRPTRATLGGVFIEPATREKMAARVWINDGGVSDFRRAESLRTNTPLSNWEEDRAASRWITPNIFGGARSEKGFEKMLERVGALDGGRFVVPGKDQPLDQFGNIGRGRLNKILSGARLFAEEGYKANATDSARSTAKGNTRYFLIKKGRRPIGIAERLGRGKGSRNNIRMALVFVRQPTYSRRFDFYGVAERIAEDQLPIQFELALAQAVATRRR